jgi:hypothetical protein
VLIYSGFFTAVFHPLILRRALYIDETRNSRLLIVVIRREGEVSTRLFLSFVFTGCPFYRKAGLPLIILFTDNYLL